MSRSSFYARRGKRAMDLAVAGAMIGLGAPVMLALAAAIRWRLGSPVLFRQQRPGRGGQIFTIYKFRTMTDARDADGKLRADSQRLTKFGALLRSTSLDELPELWNVLRGDMSLVGPRPLMIEYLERYSPRQARRHEVRPGITGWAQINGRNALSWEQKLALDVKYVENQSFWLDLKILFSTVEKVFRREDILDAAPQGSLSSYRAAQNPENEKHVN